MKRIVVVGASTGLGRCIAVSLAARGGKVALMARTVEKLNGAVEEAGENAIGIRCDVTDEESCKSAIAEAAERLGGIDAIIYAAAVGPISRVEDATADQWKSTFETNVMGASLITSAALPHLLESSGTAIYFSTVGASYTSHWPGLAVYQVTKAALERLVDAWRNEHPSVGFTRLTLGECGGGQGDSQSHFNVGWDPDVTMALAPSWFARGLLSGALMDIEHLVDAISGLVEAGASLTIPTMIITPRASHVSTQTNLESLAEQHAS